jgi:hypothetical protein
MRLEWSCLLWLLITSSAIACDADHYQEGDVIGKYQLTYDDGRIEYLTLLSDHSFVQQFGGEEHVGHWKYAVQDHRAHVFLDNQQIFVGTWAMPRGVLHGDLVVKRSADGPRLVFNEDLGWTYLKVA